MNKIKEFKPAYLIELECIDEGNDFDLKLGDISYAAGFAGCEFTYEQDDAWWTNDFDVAKEIAIEIYNKGNFRPKVKEIYKHIGAEIFIDFDNEL